MAEAQELQVAQAVQEAPEMDVIAPVLSLESLEKIEDPAKPEIQENQAVSGNACIRWTLQEHVKVDVEEIRIEDARLARSYPGSLWRLSWVSEADYTHRFGLIISPRSEDC